MMWVFCTLDALSGQQLGLLAACEASCCHLMPLFTKLTLKGSIALRKKRVNR